MTERDVFIILYFAEVKLKRFEYDKLDPQHRRRAVVEIFAGSLAGKLPHIDSKQKQSQTSPKEAYSLDKSLD